MENKTKKLCPVCNSKNIVVFFEVLQVPLYCNLQYSRRKEAINAPKGDIRLGFCKLCGHIFNLAFDPKLLKYDQEYENSLHYSPYFQGYANSLAQRLIERYGLYNKRILEIGCGKGEFLTLLCELGNNTGVGFDPSYMPNRVEKKSTENIIFIRDYFSERYSNYTADLICCRHVLEHIQYPRDFLRKLRNSLDNGANTILFFEVPNVMFTLKGLGIWDLIFEHCSYFSTPSLSHLFTACGFEVCDLTETFEGQFLTIEAFPRRGSTNSQVKLGEDIERMADHAATFRERYDNAVMTWHHKLETIQSSGKRAVVWGAGSKGVTFLNVLQVKEQIEYVVDINPHKQGKYIAGVGQKIVPPESLRIYRPDIIIIMNSIYRDEIGRVIQEFGLNPEFLTF